MKINRDNCEAFFLDFYEGRLSPEQAEELFAFLDENPGLREIFEGYEQILLDDAPVTFSEKENLKRFPDLPKTINEANCEEFFIAHAEGLLTAEHQRLLENFLQQNPGRRRDLELYSKTRLSPEAITFENKSSLKKTAEPITAENCEEFCIAAVEGLLAKDQLAELERFLQSHPEQAKVYAQFQQTRLVADASIVFEDKASLKRRAGSRLMPVWRAAAAVAVLLIFGFGVYSLFDDEPVTGSSLVNNGKHESRKAPAPGEQPGTNPAIDYAGNSTQRVKNDKSATNVNSTNAAQNEKPVLVNVPSRELALLNNEQPVPDAIAPQQEPVLANSTNKSYREEEFLTLPELAGRWAKKQLGVQEPRPTGVMAMADSKEKMDGWDWAGVAVNKISKGKAQLSNEKSDEGRTFVFELGKKIRLKRTFKK